MRQSGSNRCSSRQPLKPRPEFEKEAIANLQRTSHQGNARELAKSPQYGNGAPHCSEGSGARQQHSVLKRMKPSKHVSAITRTGGSGVGKVDEIYAPSRIKASKQRNLTPTQWATAIVPNDKATRTGHDDQSSRRELNGKERRLCNAYARAHMVLGASGQKISPPRCHLQTFLHQRPCRTAERDWLEQDAGWGYPPSLSSPAGNIQHVAEWTEARLSLVSCSITRFDGDPDRIGG